MSKKRLADLLREPPKPAEPGPGPPPADQAPPVSSAAPPAPHPAAAPAEPAPPRSRPPREEPPAPAGPRYLTYVRKDTRLRDDQLEELTRLARRLNRAKPGGDERITENTLIRIAVDMLLARERDLRGGNEEEIRRSLVG